MAGKKGADNLKPSAFELDPSERIVFVIEGPDAKPVVELKIKNEKEGGQLFKVKCTSNDLFKIRPPLGILKPGAEVTVKLTLLKANEVPVNDTHYFNVYDLATEDTSGEARKQWQGKQPTGRKRLFVRFEKAAAGTKSAADGKDDAAGAKSAADEKKDDAAGAKSAADEKKDDAAGAKSAADDKKDDAAGAKSAADEKKDDAAGAKSVADEKKDDAAGAKSVADEKKGDDDKKDADDK